MPETVWRGTALAARGCSALARAATACRTAAGGSTAGVSGVNTSSGFGVLGKATGSTGQGCGGRARYGFFNGAGSDGVYGVSHRQQARSRRVNDAKMPRESTAAIPKATALSPTAMSSRAAARAAGSKPWHTSTSGHYSPLFQQSDFRIHCSTVPCGITVNAILSARLLSTSGSR